MVADADGERAAIAALPLDRLPLEPAARDLLEKLGAATVEHFLRLPYAELLRRFGAPVAELRRTACAPSRLPVQGLDAEPPLLQRRRLTYRASDAERLLRHCRVLLDRLLDRLQQGTRAVAELQLQLLLEDGSRRHELIRPASPTRRRRLLLDLLALRLRALDLTAGVEELALDARHTPLPAGQGELFRTSQGRDPAAGAAALAGIRAEFGDAAVACAVLQESHLPEAQYRWQPVGTLPAPRPPAITAPGVPLIRRVLARAAGDRGIGRPPANTPAAPLLRAVPGFQRMVVRERRYAEWRYAARQPPRRPRPRQSCPLRLRLCPRWRLRLCRRWTRRSRRPRLLPDRLRGRHLGVGLLRPPYVRRWYRQGWVE